MSWQQTPVFITNRDNLTRGFTTLLDWLVRIGMTDIRVIDNGSTYTPLLDYDVPEHVTVTRYPDNVGPYALWERGLVPRDTRFILTDPDVVPARDPRTPDDLIEQMHHIMDVDPAVVKVGPSLRIDNLPDCYARKREVIDWEKQFWVKPASQWPAYDSGIDTTFALYREGSASWPGGRYLRLAPPYQFEHVPWYEDSAKPSDEERYYREHAKKGWVNW